MAEIGTYYQRSIRQARRIVADPAFPPPVRGDSRRWLAASVRAYAAGTWETEAPVVEPTVLRRGTATSNRVVRRNAA